MLEENKGKFGFIAFFLFILALIISGFVFLNWEKKDEDTIISETADKMKKDKDKDFIYFEDISPLSVELQIIYKVPVINFESIKVEEINEKLKTEVVELKTHTVALDSVSEEQKANALYTTDNIYSAKVRDYQVLEYQEYLSLVIKDYDYICTGMNGESTYTTYIFLKTTGELLTLTDTLKRYDKNYSDVLDIIREKLNSDQSVNEDGSNLIDIDATMNNINNNLVGYVDNNGDLVLLYIVKSSNNNYNESIVIKK